LEPGDRVHQRIWTELRAAELVILIITPKFLESRECTYELGITAALGLPAVPLVSKDISFESLKAPVSESFGGPLKDESSLFALYDHVHSRFGDPSARVAVVQERVRAVCSLAAAEGY
jgi:hypothetical protein